MKKYNTLKTVLPLFGLCLLFACRKSDIRPFITDPVFTPGNLITANLTGRITDNGNYPISGATVTAGGKTTTTDINGQFTITNASLSSNAASVKVAKNGFFTSYRTLIVKAGATHAVSLVLIAKGASQNFTAASGGTVNLGNGCNIQFPASSVVVESSGAAYNGAVTVSSFFLNPTDSNFTNYMPGDLRGINSNNNEQLLQSYGMVVAELQGSSGEKLQLATGKTATITMPIASSLQASAPDSIPLWHFDEAIGIWKEKGKAAKQGNTYKGTVTHFSFWNYDVPFSLVRYSATFLDQQGNPLAYCRVSFKRPNGDTRYGTANAAGFLEAIIPSDERLTMAVTAGGYCSSTLLTKDIGPYRTDINAGSISVNTSTANLVTVTGTVKRCNGLPLSAGFVEVLTRGQISRTSLTNGVFSFQHECIGPNTNTTVTLVAYDSATGFASPAKVIVVTGGNTFDVGQLTINCPSNIGAYMYLTVDSIPYSWVGSASDSLFGSRNSDPAINSFTTRVNYQAVPMLANKPYLQFAFSGPMTGANFLTSFQFLPNGSSNPSNVYSIVNQAPNAVRVYVTEFGAVGSYTAGNFIGTVVRNGIVVPLHCSFRVRLLP